MRVTALAATAATAVAAAAAAHAVTLQEAMAAAAAVPPTSNRLQPPGPFSELSGAATAAWALGTAPAAMLVARHFVHGGAGAAIPMSPGAAVGTAFAAPPHAHSAVQTARWAPRAVADGAGAAPVHSAAAEAPRADMRGHKRSHRREAPAVVPLMLDPWSTQTTAGASSQAANPGLVRSRKRRGPPGASCEAFGTADTADTAIVDVAAVAAAPTRSGQMTKSAARTNAAAPDRPQPAEGALVAPPVAPARTQDGSYPRRTAPANAATTNAAPQTAVLGHIASPGLIRPRKRRAPPGAAAAAAGAGAVGLGAGKDATVTSADAAVAAAASNAGGTAGAAAGTVLRQPETTVGAAAITTPAAAAVAIGSGDAAAAAAAPATATIEDAAAAASAPTRSSAHSALPAAANGAEPANQAEAPPGEAAEDAVRGDEAEPRREPAGDATAPGPTAVRTATTAAAMAGAPAADAGVLVQVGPALMTAVDAASQPATEGTRGRPAVAPAAVGATAAPTEAAPPARPVAQPTGPASERRFEAIPATPLATTVAPPDAARVPTHVMVPAAAAAPARRAPEARAHPAASGIQAVHMAVAAATASAQQRAPHPAQVAAEALAAARVAAAARASATAAGGRPHPAQGAAVNGTTPSARPTQFHGEFVSSDVQSDAADAGAGALVTTTAVGATTPSVDDARALTHETSAATAAAAAPITGAAGSLAAFAAAAGTVAGESASAPPDALVQAPVRSSAAACTAPVEQPPGSALGVPAATAGPAAALRHDRATHAELPPAAVLQNLLAYDATAWVDHRALRAALLEPPYAAELTAAARRMDSGLVDLAAAADVRPVGAALTALQRALHEGAYDDTRLEEFGARVAAVIGGIADASHVWGEFLK